MKPICVKCQKFYRIEKNGVRFVEKMPIGGHRSPPGTAAPHLWKDYKIWSADLWICHGCGHEIIIGAARQPIAEHYMPDYDQKRARDEHLIACEVNDC